MKLLFLIFYLFFINIVLSQSVIAQSIGVSPDTLTFDAVRGSEHHKTLSLFNSGKKNLSFLVSSQELDIFNFTPKKGVVGPGESIKVDVLLNVPEDMPNGEYYDAIYLKTFVSNETPSGSSLSFTFGIGVKVIIKITGTQVIGGFVNNIWVDDAEVNSVAVFSVDFSNIGNIQAGPLIFVGVDDMKNNTVYEISRGMEKINAGQNTIYSVAWNTAGMIPAEYSANVSLALGTRLLSEKTLKFRLEEQGFFKRKGILNSISTTNVTLGEPVKINAFFENTGDTNVFAKLKSEIYDYSNTRLIYLADSEEQLILIGEEAELSAFFIPENPGKYLLRTYVIFGGKKTKAKEMVVEVYDSNRNDLNEITGFSIMDFSKGNVSYAVLMIVLCVVLVIGVVAYFWKRKNS